MREVEVTDEFLRMNTTSRGQWTAAQLAVLGVPWPPPNGWKKRVLGMKISAHTADEFVKAATAFRSRGRRERETWELPDGEGELRAELEKLQSMPFNATTTSEDESRRLYRIKLSVASNPRRPDMVRIRVTQRDIDKGVRGNGEQCPIARALKRATGRYWFVSSYYCRDESGSRSGPLIALPVAVTEFVNKFDKRGGRLMVKPTAFDIPGIKRKTSEQPKETDR